MGSEGVTWSELRGILTVAGSILAVMGAVLTGAWYVYNAIKRQFETQTARFDKQFDMQATKAEERTRHTHERIEGLGREIRETFTPRDLFHAEVRRLDQANEERDRQLIDLAERLRG